MSQLSGKNNNRDSRSLEIKSNERFIGRKEIKTESNEKVENSSNNNNKNFLFIMNSQDKINTQGNKNNEKNPKNQNHKDIQDKNEVREKAKNKSNDEFKGNTQKYDNNKNNTNLINGSIDNNIDNNNNSQKRESKRDNRQPVKYVFGNSKLYSLINSIDNYAKKIDKVIANGDRTNLMLTKLIDILIEKKSKEKEQAQGNLNKDENKDKKM